MHIGFLEPSLHGGGAERAVRAWAGFVQKSGHDVSIFTYIRGPYDDYGDPHPPLGVKHYCCETDGLGPVTRARKLVHWLPEICHRTGVNVVVSVLTYCNLVAIAAFWRHHRAMPVVIMEHCALSPLLRSQGISGRAKLLIARSSYRRASAVIGVSHAVAGDLAGSFGVTSERLWVIPNPVFGEEKVVRQTDTVCVTSSGKRLRLVFVGRLSPEKRPELVVETLLELSSRGIDAEGIVFGAGPMEQKLVSLAADYGVRLVMAGWRDDWSAALPLDGAQQCLLLPSLAEGFGYVLVEATSKGLPCVAPSQALGVGDAIVPGVSGVFALSSRPAHLADAVLRAISIEWQDQTSWLEWFSVKNSGTRLLEMLSTCYGE